MKQRTYSVEEVANALGTTCGAVVHRAAQGRLPAALISGANGFREWRILPTTYLNDAVKVHTANAAYADRCSDEEYEDRLSDLNTQNAILRYELQQALSLLQQTKEQIEASNSQVERLNERLLESQRARAEMARRFDDEVAALVQHFGEPTAGEMIVGAGSIQDPVAEAG